MIIRQAQKNDLPTISQVKNPRTDKLRRELEKIARERINHVKTRESALLVAEDNGQIVGHVHLRLKDPQHSCSWIEDLYVKEAERHRGIGTALIEAGESFVRANGHSNIGISVNPTLNAHVKKLYEKLGYRKTGRPAYLDGVYDGTEDWVVDMEKPLK